MKKYTNKHSELPYSPLIADITLQDLENKAIRHIPFNLQFYYRYVDDIALAVPSSMFNEVLVIFNSFHPRLHSGEEN